MFSATGTEFIVKEWTLMASFLLRVGRHPGASCLVFLKMAHPLTVEIHSAIYSFDTPIFPYWFMGIQVMSRMFSYEVQRWNKCLKTHDRRSLSVSPKFFHAVPLSWLVWHYWCNVFVRVMACDVMSCHHMSQESHIASVSCTCLLRFRLQSWPKKNTNKTFSDIWN